MSRFLITTADESLWKFDRPVIFLGEWCRLFDRQDSWKNMDAIVASPYCKDLSSRDLLFAEARSLEEAIFPILCEALNAHHNIKGDIRYWKIILGHWFRRYVDVMVNRVKTLEKCFSSHAISGTAKYCEEYYTLATQNSNEAIWAFNDDRWNAELMARLIERLDGTSCNFELVNADKTDSFSYVGSASNPALRVKIINWFYTLVDTLFMCFVKDDDAFIISTYLPKIEAIKLQLSLRQVPQRWTYVNRLSRYPINLPLRKKLSDQMKVGPRSKLEDLLKEMFFELLPACYLEGFAELNKVNHEKKWPKKPKFIFTSNSFDTHEEFKVWAANKIKEGAKYYVGQHGNNYGSSRFLNKTIEEITADKFLTWGWVDNLPQHVPSFMLKNPRSGYINNNPKGGLLLIELHPPQRLSLWDVDSEFRIYFEEQKKFVSELDLHPKQNLTIRLHARYDHFKWNEPQRWQKFDSGLNVDVGVASIGSLVAKSRLVVHSYDSTGLLELLNQNIPTIAFWQNGLEHLRESAHPFYQLLAEVGIVHYSPESASRHVNEVWDDVQEWWQGAKVQAARVRFCERYAKSATKPTSELKSIFLT